MVGLVGGILGAFELEKVGGLSTCFLLYAHISRIWGATVGLFKSGCLYKSRYRHRSL